MPKNGSGQGLKAGRGPLPVICQATNPPNTHANYWPRVSDALLPPWSPQGVEGEAWYEDDVFVDPSFETGALPSWLRPDTAKWVRASDYASQAREKHTTAVEPSSTLPHIVSPQVLSTISLTDYGFALVSKMTGVEDQYQSREQDEIGASILRLVARRTESRAGMQRPFLWEAIYPQDETGHPYYNPGGKYIVKLFVSGMWRKVCVDDRVPVDAVGQATIVSSHDRHELWPLILAKASYKVVNLAGCVSGRDGLSPQKMSDFVALATTALTGWLAAPISPPPPFGSDWTLQTIDAFIACRLRRGTPQCSIQEINLATSSELPGQFLKKHSSKSSRRRRGRSREPSEEILRQAASMRNKAAAALTEKLMAPRSELVVVVATEPARASVKPLLAVIPAAIDREKGGSALLEWSCRTSDTADFRPGGKSPEPVTITKPFCELLQANSTSYLLAFSTRYEMPHTVNLRHSWVEACNGMGFVPPPQSAPKVIHVDTSTQSAVLSVGLQADVPVLAMSHNETGSQTAKIPMRNAVLMLEELAPLTELSVCSENAGQSPVVSKPMVSLRLTLQLSGPYPTATATLAIPTAPRGRVYRVVLDAPFGANATFSSTVPVLCDQLPTVCKKLNGWAACAQGNYDPIHPDQNIVLFRRAIRLVNPSTGNSNYESNLHLDLPTFLDVALQVSLSDQTVAEHVTLHALDTEGNVLTSHPLLRLQQIRIPRGDSGVIVTATLCTPRAAPLPAGSWALVAYSMHGNASEAVEFHDLDKGKGQGGALYHFGSMYEPNRHLRLFRDIIDVRSECFPMYINLDVTSANEGMERCAENYIPIRFLVYDSKYKRKLLTNAVADNAGCSEYLKTRRVCLPCHWPRQLQHVTNMPDQSVQIVVEAVLDSDILHLDKNLYSSGPYKEASSDLELVQGHKLKWVLALHAAAEGVLIRHNDDQEETHDVIRERWEAGEPGRAERATKMRDQLLSGSLARPTLDNNHGALDDTKKVRETKRVALCDAIVTPQLCGKRHNWSSKLFTACSHPTDLEDAEIGTISTVIKWREGATKEKINILSLREMYRTGQVGGSTASWGAARGRR